MCGHVTHKAKAVNSLKKTFMQIEWPLEIRVIGVKVERIVCTSASTSCRFVVSSVQRWTLPQGPTYDYNCALRSYLAVMLLLL